MPMNRRQALKLVVQGGIPMGVLAGAGFGAYRALLPPAPSHRLEPVDVLAARLVASLDAGQRARVQVDYDHPLRQYHNRGVSGGGLGINAWRFSREQRVLLSDLLHAGVSTKGRDRLPRQFFINWPGVHLMRLLVCGEPGAGPYQIILTGPHLNLRLGGASREGAALGGPQIYGDQRGNERQGLPGNVYRGQFLAAHRLFLALSPSEQQAALLPSSPIQTRIEPQGRGGRFPGVPVAALSPAARELAAELVGGILSTYPAGDVAYARRCLEENGGLGALHLSYYEDGEVDGSGQYQIFRLEGPTAVLYFRGYPHVHAFINIAMDPDRPFSVGEVLGDNPRVLESPGVQALFQQAMQDQTGADLAHYPAESAVGRLRAGSIRTGDIYTLESWQDVVATLRLPGRRIGGELRRRLDQERFPLEPDRDYTVATTGYGAGDGAREALGGTFPWTRRGRLRDLTIAYLKAHGFGAVA